jgi:hypothetical protein
MNDQKLLEDVDRAMLRRFKRAITSRKSTMDELSEYTAAVDKIRNRLMTRHKMATAIRVARIRARALAARAAPTRRQPADDSAPDRELESMLAPYGRKRDGTPHSHREFCETLQQAVAEIYGLDFDAIGVAGSTKSPQRADPANESSSPSEPDEGGIR